MKILWEIERIPSNKQGRYYLTWLIFFLIDGFDFLSSHLDGSPSPLPPPSPDHHPSPRYYYFLFLFFVPPRVHWQWKVYKIEYLYCNQRLNWIHWGLMTSRELAEGWRPGGSWHSVGEMALTGGPSIIHLDRRSAMAGQRVPTFTANDTPVGIDSAPMQLICIACCQFPYLSAAGGCRGNRRRRLATPPVTPGWYDQAAIVTWKWYRR